MREILFRGKQQHTGVWVYGCYIEHPQYNGLRWIWDGHAPIKIIDPETVGQYTGLTDRNGQRIFEGDIVKHHRELWGKDASVFGVVFWDAEKCRFCRTSSPCPENCYAESERAEKETPEMWASAAADYEVIGNIHDNPELV